MINVPEHFKKASKAETIKMMGKGKVKQYFVEYNKNYSMFW